MENKKTAVFGIYTILSAADTATDELIKSGFSPSDVSALLPDNLGNRPIGTEKATKAPEGAAAGAGSGAVLGGALGLLAGIGALAASEEQLADLPAHSSAWAFPSTKQNATRADYRRAASCFPSTAILPRRSNEPRKS
jgi:hypothetical protein